MGNHDWKHTEWQAWCQECKEEHKSFEKADVEKWRVDHATKTGHKPENITIFSMQSGRLP